MLPRFVLGLSPFVLMSVMTSSSVMASIPNPGVGDYVLPLSTSTMDAEVSRVVDAGKTLMAPAWNAITKKYAHNPSVEFGDVILSENRVTESHGTPQNPGAGGWPTIRYYNKETGYGGAPYPKKHEGMAMCDELGDEGRMEDYVVEVSGASLCNIKTHDGCTDKEKEFVEKMSKASDSEVSKQLARLSKMGDGSMKPDLKQWVKQRVAILKQLAKESNL